MENSIILNPVLLRAISYKEKIFVKDNEMSLINLDVIVKGKTVHRLDFEVGSVKYEKGIGEKILCEYLIKIIQKDKTKNKFKNKKEKKKASKKDTYKAAIDLMNELGL